MSELRLSAAIRLGAMLKPQAFNQTGVDTSCALKAAQEASGCAKGVLPDYTALRAVFPILNAEIARCPQCTDVLFRKRRLLVIVWHLNDYHRWTREAIADFVELHEALPEPSVVSPELEVTK